MEELDLENTIAFESPQKKEWQKVAQLRLKIVSIESAEKEHIPSPFAGEDMFEKRADLAQALAKASEATLKTGHLEDELNFADTAAWVLAEATRLRRAIGNLEQQDTKEHNLDKLIELSREWQQVADDVSVAIRKKHVELERSIREVLYYETARNFNLPPRIDAVRHTYARVKVLYAGVQHKLTEDQRRDFRTRITQLAKTIRREREVSARLASAAQTSSLIVDEIIKSG